MICKKFLQYLAAIGFLAIALAARTSAAETTCPLGLESDAYPGQCGAYYDKDEDGLCDYSVASVSPADSGSNQARSTQGSAGFDMDGPVVNGQAGADGSENSGNRRRYPFIPLSIAILGMYAASSFAARAKLITLLAHRRIWNSILLISFLASGLLGLLLVIRINYGYAFPLGLNQLWWHVTAGVVMALVSFAHIAWHWRYYACIFRKKQAVSCDRDSLKAGG